MKIKSNYGFTLIEILVVVVIVSILTVLGVQMISSGSVERTLQQQGRMLRAAIEFSCDQATLQNIPYGVNYTVNGYSFSQFVNQQWIGVFSQEALISKELNDTVLSLSIDGQAVVLPKEASEIPQIVCDASGQITSFVLVISDALKQHYYQLKTNGFWSLEGQWLDDKKR